LLAPSAAPPAASAVALSLRRSHRARIASAWRQWRQYRKSGNGFSISKAIIGVKISVGGGGLDKPIYHRGYRRETSRAA